MTGLNGVKEECQERSERQRGWCEPPPCVPGKKGSNLFYMIPLERWNTEHRFDSTAKGYLVTTVYPLSLALMEHDVSFVFRSVLAWRNRKLKYGYS